MLELILVQLLNCVIKFWNSSCNLRVEIIEWVLDKELALLPFLEQIPQYQSALLILIQKLNPFPCSVIKPPFFESKLALIQISWIFTIQSLKFSLKISGDGFLFSKRVLNFVFLRQQFQTKINIVLKCS